MPTAARPYQFAPHQFAPHRFAPYRFVTPMAIAPGPVTLIGALVASAWLAAGLPGGRWSDALALLASAAALFAAHDHRDRDMIVAAGLAAGLAPAGWVLAPLWLGWAIRRPSVRRHVPLGALAAALACVMLPWSAPATTLPNLAALAVAMPTTWALVIAASVGCAAWLFARASTLTRPALFTEARLGAILLAALLPLPLGVLGFALVLAALPIPVARHGHAANDNMMLQRTTRRAAQG